MNENETSRNEVDNVDEDPDEDQDERLKGDAIGETLYSESWVLKTLIKLTQELPYYSKVPDLSSKDDDGDEAAASATECDGTVELKEELETDLCLLWDMTADKDVAFCVFNNQIIPLSKAVLEESRAPRLTEIVIGILANISCQREIAEKIATDDEVMAVLCSLLSNRDSQTVIQCVRLLDTLLRSLNSEKLTNVTTSSSVWNDISFALQNSLNEDLLTSAAKLLDILVSHLDLESDLTHLPHSDILQGILECQAQLLKDNDPEVVQDLPSNVRDSLDALTSALYNLSRCNIMRTLIEEKREAVGPFLHVYLRDLLRRVEESSTESSPSLVASAVEAITVFFIVIDTQLCSKILEHSARIGATLSSMTDVEYVSDYREMMGDCCRKILSIFQPQQVLVMLEALDSPGLRFLLQESHRASKDKTEELISTAKTLGSFNKVVDTFDSALH